MPVSEETYKRVALEDQDEKWELHCGRLRRKPPMTTEHNVLGWLLGHSLQSQLPLTDYLVAVDNGKVRCGADRFYIPDVAVIPMQLVRQLLARPHTFEAYADPLPLIAEVWSPSTGEYDVRSKLLEYQRRGDREIWLLHPYERTLQAWRWQPDGSYPETMYTGGMVQPVALPNVTIDLDTLFG